MPRTASEGIQERQVAVASWRLIMIRTGRKRSLAGHGAAWRRWGVGSHTTRDQPPPLWSRARVRMMIVVITVLLADDNLIVREGVRAMLSREEDIEVVAVAADHDELLAEAARTTP